MSMKVTKVDGSVDENSGLKYTVGDKSLGLLSTSIDKALSNMLKDEEAQLKCSPEYAEGATINLTLVQVAEKHEQKARRGLVSVQGKSIVDLDADSTAWRTQNASRLDEFDACLMNEKAISDKTTTEKAESENVDAESVLSPTGVDRESGGRKRPQRRESGYREVYCCKCCSRGGRCEDEPLTNTTTVQ